MNTISKKSLWYKIHQILETEEYKTLRYNGKVNICPWFWSGLFGGLVILTIGVLSIIVMSIVGYLLVNFLAFLLGGFIVFSWVNLDYSLVVLIWFIVSSIFGVITLLIDTMLGDIPVLPKYVSKHLPKKVSKVKQEEIKSKVVKEPNIFTQYYRTWKNKFCFGLTLKEEEK